MSQGRWVQKWKVASRSGHDPYVVSISSEMKWGCSCPIWKFRRQECHHIEEVKTSLRVKDGDGGANMKLIAIMIDKLKREGKTDDEIIEALADKDTPILEPFYSEAHAI